MSDDLMIRNARRGPSTATLAALVVVGLLVTFGLYTLAPESEHAPEAAPVGVTAADEAADGHGAPTGDGAAPGDRDAAGGDGSRSPDTSAALFGRSLGPSPVSATATFEAPEGDCPGGNAFVAQVQLYTPELGQLFVRRQTSDGVEEAEGTLAESGEFRARSGDGRVSWTGRLSIGTSTATYVRRGAGCVDTYRVSLRLNR